MPVTHKIRLTPEAKAAFEMVGACISADANSVLGYIKIDIRADGFRLEATNSSIAARVIVGDWLDNGQEDLTIVVDPRGGDLRKAVFSRAVPLDIEVSEDGVDCGVVQFRSSFMEFPKLDRFFEEAEKNHKGLSFKLGLPVLGPLGTVSKALKRLRASQSGAIEFFPSVEPNKPLRLVAGVDGLAVDIVAMVCH